MSETHTKKKKNTLERESFSYYRERNLIKLQTLQVKLRE